MENCFWSEINSEFDRENLKFSYPLVSLSTLEYHVFLNSNKPEEITLEILENFKRTIEFVTNLLIESHFTIDKIAGVAVHFVKSIQRQLSAK
jgi:hypothetical protein